MSVKKPGMEQKSPSVPIPENLNSASSIFGEETGIMEVGHRNTALCGALGFEKREKGYRRSKVSVHLQECSDAPWAGGTRLQGFRSSTSSWIHTAAAPGAARGRGADIWI